MMMMMKRNGNGARISLSLSLTHSLRFPPQTLGRFGRRFEKATRNVSVTDSIKSQQKMHLRSGGFRLVFAKADFRGFQESGENPTRESD